MAKNELTEKKDLKTKRRPPRGLVHRGYDSKAGKRAIKNVLGETQAEFKEKRKATIVECQGLDVNCTEEYTAGT